MNKPVVTLHKDQTLVTISPEQQKRAIHAAFYMTCSPHEWQWSQSEQEAMAAYVLWAHQRLSAIEQLCAGEFSID